MTPLADVRCVLFDLDGTLIDSATDLGQAADEMRRLRGLQRTGELPGIQIEHLILKPSDFRRFFALCDLSY